MIQQWQNKQFRHQQQSTNHSASYDQIFISFKYQFHKKI